MVDTPKLQVALDVDGVLCDFNQGILDRAKKMGLGDSFPPRTNWITEWNYGGDAWEPVWNSVKDDESFWLSLNPYPGAVASINFEVSAYISNRPTAPLVTLAWLQRHGFPSASVTHVTGAKSHTMRRVGAHVLIEDRYENWLEINEQGACGFGMRSLLLDRPWNRKYEAGRFRIKSLGEVMPLVMGKKE